MGAAINNLTTICRVAAVTLLIGVVALSVAFGAPSLTVVAGPSTSAVSGVPANGTVVVGLVEAYTETAPRADDLSVVMAHTGRTALLNTGSNCSHVPEQSVTPVVKMADGFSVTLSSKDVSAFYWGYSERHFG